MSGPVPGIRYKIWLDRTGTLQMEEEKVTDMTPPSEENIKVFMTLSRTTHPLGLLVQLSAIHLGRKLRSPNLLTIGPNGSLYLCNSVLVGDPDRITRGLQLRVSAKRKIVVCEGRPSQ